VQRIVPCKEFWWKNEAMGTEFFGKVILPELMGKAFTRKTAHVLRAQN